MSESVISQRAPEPVGAYPHAKRVGNLLFLSGIGPRKRGSKDIPGVTQDDKGNIVSYDIAAQCHSVFKNVRTILEDAGAHWENIVDVTVFLTNMRADFPVFNRLYAEYFATTQPNKFEHIAFLKGPQGLPLLPAALAHLECRKVHAYSGGDHTIFVGEVEAAGVGKGEPLLYYRGQYNRVRSEDSRS